MTERLITIIEEHHIGEYAFLPLDNDMSAVLLYSPYKPFANWEYDTAEIDAYYFASQESYYILKKIKESLTNNGFRLTSLPNNDLKVFSEKCGARRGKNNLVFLDKLGSFFVIQCIIIEGTFDKRISSTELNCEGCDKCIRACPSSALNDGYKKDKCLRYWQNYANTMPQEIRATNGKRLIGCNVCQVVCPFNPKSTTMQSNRQNEMLKIQNLVLKKNDKDFLKELGNMIGTNYARKSRLNAMLSLILNKEV